MCVISALSLAFIGCNDNSDFVAEEPIEEVVTLTKSEIDFSNCQELAGGVAVGKASLEAKVPDNVGVLSLTDIGFVFEGSDDLGILIVRSVSCESVTVTDSDGETATDENIVFAHVGTPINTSNLPATTYNKDGVNGADFNNYTFSYTTTSAAFMGAMERAGLQNVSLNQDIVHELIDLNPDECGISSLLINVPGDDEFAFTVSGQVVEATAECNPGGADFVANWWSIDENNQVTALSNEIFDQTFADSATTDVFLTTRSGKEINNIIGSNSTRFTGFVNSGYIVSGGTGNLDMVAEPLGEAGQ